MSSHWSNTDRQNKHVLISGLVYDQGKSGIAEYTRQLVDALGSRQNTTIALLQKDIPHFPAHEGKVEILAVSNLFSHPIMNILWHLLVLPVLLFQRKYEWLILPAINRRMGLWYPKPAIGIAHDLSQFSVNNKYDLFRTAYVKCLLPLCLSGMSHIFAISHNTKKDLVKYWGLDADKIQVSYNGYDHTHYHAQVPDTAQHVISTYEIEQPYLVYVSRIEHPGKNHARLIRAFDALSDEEVKDRMLVFAGSDWSGAEEVKSIAAQAKRAKQIRFLGFVPTDHLPALYHQAEMMLFPSLYEGFGIPLIEAMACGTPCLCSNNSALGEIAGDAAFTFDPSSITAIQKTLSFALTHPEQLANKAKKGLQHCQLFSWDKLASDLSDTMAKAPIASSFRGYVKHISSQSLS